MHQVWVVSSTVLFGVYRSVYLDRVAEVFIPEHTRDAAFQLFCDLRTNSPKDGAFLRRHATALKPRTYLGWLAAASFMLCAAAYSAAATAIALGIAVALINVILVLSVLGGVTLAIALSCTGVALFVGACVAGSTACTVAIAYTSLESAKAVTNTAGRLLLGAPRKQGTEQSAAQLGAAPQQPALEAGPYEPLQSLERGQLSQELASGVGMLFAAAAAKEPSSPPQPDAPAALHALEQLGLGIPARVDREPALAAAEERRPLLPVKDLSTNIPPAPPTPPELEGIRHGPLSAMSPTKRRRAAASELEAIPLATPGQAADVFVDASSSPPYSTASDTSQAPDLQGFMDHTFMGSPPHSRSSTPGRQRAAAAS
jgi:hypothetical protein